MNLRYFAVIFFLVYNSSFAQLNPTDSLSKYKAEYYLNINIDSVFHYGNLLKSSQSSIAKYDGSYRLISAYYKKGDYIKSEELTNELIQSIGNSNNKYLKTLKLECYNKLFWIYKNTNRPDKIFQISLLVENLVDDFDQNDIYFEKVDNFKKSIIANIKIELGLYDEAIYSLKLLENRFSNMIPELSGNKKNRALIFKSGIFNTIGRAYLSSSSYKKDPLIDSASLYFRKAYEISKLINPRHKDSELHFSLERVKVHIKRENYYEALNLLEHSEVVDVEKNELQEVYFLKSDIFKKINEIDSSIYYAYKFLNLKKNSPSTEKNKIQVYKNLAEIYKSINKIDSTYKYTSLVNKKQNDLFRNTNEDSSKRSLSDFIHEQGLRNQLILIIFSLLFFLLLFNFFYKQQKLKMKKKNLVENKKPLIPKKKQLYINKELEQKLLEKLLVFEKSNLFLDHKFNIQFLAKKLKTNTSYLSHIINEKKGRTFKQYTTELRINYLLKELKNNHQLRKYTIKALGKEIGYTDASAFTRAFKNFIGKSPSEYISTLK